MSSSGNAVSATETASPVPRWTCCSTKSMWRPGSGAQRRPWTHAGPRGQRRRRRGRGRAGPPRPARAAPWAARRADAAAWDARSRMRVPSPAARTTADRDLDCRVKPSPSLTRSFYSTVRQTLRHVFSRSRARSGGRQPVAGSRRQAGSGQPVADSRRRAGAAGRLGGRPEAAQREGWADGRRRRSLRTAAGACGSPSPRRRRDQSSASFLSSAGNPILGVLSSVRPRKRRRE